MSIPRVLVVDDDHAQRFLFAQLLKRTGFDVVSVSSGETALETLENDSNFDAILTDLTLPGLSGNELVKELHRRCAGVPTVVMSVLALSEWTNPEALSKCIYLQKPFDRERLVDAIRAAAGKAKPVA